MTCKDHSPLNYVSHPCHWALEFAGASVPNMTCVPNKVTAEPNRIRLSPHVDPLSEANCAPKNVLADDNLAMALDR